MNRTLRSRRCRCCVCLILVLVLLISWSPIRAKAVGTEQYVAVVIDKVGFYAQAGAVSTGAAVFGWVLAGLGLIVSTAQTIELMNDYMEWSGELDTAIYYYPDGSWSYGVDMGFVERVRAFLFDTGILVKNDKLVLDSVKYPPAHALATAKAANYAVLVYVDKSGYISYHLAYSNESQIKVETPYANNTGVSIRTVDSGASIYLYQESTDQFNKFTTTAVGSSSLHKVVSAQYFGELIIPDIVTEYEGAEIAVVAPPEFDISVGYPEWHINARPATNPDTDEEITVLPIPLNPSVAPETQIGTLTQPDIWQGSIADPMPDTDTNPDTGTDTDDPDSGSNDPTTPTTGTDNPDSPGDDGSQDIPLTPDQLQPFVVDLRDFFPFCIPFDLYDFFQLLDADPVAPVFHWEIQDLAGNVYSIDIDLSAWDSTALFFRRLQLLVFTVGLAMASRKFIKW